MTKNDVAILEYASPPDGEKRVFLFPRIFGGTDYDSFQKNLLARAQRNFNRGYVEFSYHAQTMFRVNGNRFTVHDVVNFLNKPSVKRCELMRMLIFDIFTEFKKEV